MLILLDIDGVMVPANSWKKPEFLNDGFPVFSHKATKALQRIISETSATILLTTSHKSNYEIKEWKNIFKLRDIKVNKIDRLCENTNHLNRKEEIINWWFNSKNSIYEDFIIIDDDKSLNALPKLLKNKLIQTSASVGLTDELANEALKIMKKEIHTLV
jgi:HAD domain in Swiss Army Knife RNA repair proteins